MATVSEETPATLATFAAICEALGIAPGSRRLDIFLALPEFIQQRALAEAFPEPAKPEQALD